MSGTCQSKAIVFPFLVAEMVTRSAQPGWARHSWISCELHEAPHGEHYSMLHELTRDVSLWGRWKNGVVTLLPLPH
ncbi:hypothetical protein AB0I22_39635, partial [Streptomyces sp. NPDC050610]